MFRQILFAALAVSAAACGPVDSTDGDSSGGSFMAFASSFSGYHAWKSFHLDHGTQADGVHDVNAPLTAYLREMPPKGATSFPVGTIIVKEVEEGPIAERQVFAMVKRGGGYNPDGAVGWEWFELNRNPGAGDTVRIVWSGVQPPEGDEYSHGEAGACNGCHMGAKRNDYVWSAPLSLKALENAK
jgi:hypothetical protein